MLTACWSAKGGSGTTIVAVSIAFLVARAAPEGSLLVDLAGDVAPLLACTGDEPGVTEWLAASEDVGEEALSALEIDVGRKVRLLPFGRDPMSLAMSNSERLEVLAKLLASDGRPVVVDVGSSLDAVALAAPLLRSATSSLLVMRPCYLAVRRALLCGARPTGVVLIDEPGRALRVSDIESVLGVSVSARLELDPAVARAADAGLLAHRLPRTLERGLRHAA